MATRQKAVIVVTGGEANLMFQTDGVDVTIFDLDADWLYIYKDKYICSVLAVNENGTVDLVCTDSSDGDEGCIGSRFIGVDTDDVEFYGENLETGLVSDDDEDDY